MKVTLRRSHRVLFAATLTLVWQTGLHSSATAAQYFESAPFVTSRVNPAGVENTLPFRAVGQLFFSDPASGKEFKCSGAVIAPRLVLTAAHCLSHPATAKLERRLFVNFRFVPAASTTGGAFGIWWGSKVFVTDSWYTSDGAVPNSSDYGLLQIDNRPMQVARGLASQVTQSVGSSVGWLPWRISALSGNMTTVLGYPCNLDACTRMEITTAPAVKSSTAGLFVAGTAMGFGAEGSPAIVGFGEAPSSKVDFGLGRNEIRGVFERTFADGGYEYGYIVELDQAFSDLYRLACAAATGSC